MIWFKKFIARFNKWGVKHNHQLILFTAVMVSLFLLHSVGYFFPFFPITINFIVLVGLILSIFLLGAESSAFFIIAILFWIVALFFKLTKIDVWADRTGIYVYESLIIGVIRFISETFNKGTKQ